MPLHERIALYSIADCAVVTATRDGMNLVSYEYVACREGPLDEENGEETSGPTYGPQPRNSMLVVSEFVGCSPSLSGAIRVRVPRGRLATPWSLADPAMRAGLEEGDARCRRRLRPDAEGPNREDVTLEAQLISAVPLFHR